MIRRIEVRRRRFRGPRWKTGEFAYASPPGNQLAHFAPGSVRHRPEREVPATSSREGFRWNAGRFVMAGADSEQRGSRAAPIPSEICVLKSSRTESNASMKRMSEYSASCRALGRGGLRPQRTWPSPGEAAALSCPYGWRCRRSRCAARCLTGTFARPVVGRFHPGHGGDGCQGRGARCGPS